MSYFERGTNLYQASKGRDLRGVAAPLWQDRGSLILADQARWRHARAKSPQWQTWDRKYQRAVGTRWDGERTARRYAAERYAQWRGHDFRTPAPRLREEMRLGSQNHRRVMDQAAVAARRDGQPAFTPNQAWETRALSGKSPKVAIERPTIAERRGMVSDRGASHNRSALAPERQLRKTEQRQVSSRAAIVPHEKLAARQLMRRADERRVSAGAERRGETPRKMFEAPFRAERAAAVRQRSDVRAVSAQPRRLERRMAPAKQRPVQHAAPARKAASAQQLQRRPVSMVQRQMQQRQPPRAMERLEQQRRVSTQVQMQQRQPHRASQGAEQQRRISPQVQMRVNQPARVANQTQRQSVAVAERPTTQARGPGNPGRLAKRDR